MFLKLRSVNQSNSIFNIILLFGLPTLLVFDCGCSNKPMTRSRTEMIEDAQKKGVELASIEDEIANFRLNEQRHRERLIDIIRARSGPEQKDENYRFGPNDELEINVFDVPELNLTARVRPSGFLSLPLIGAVRATDLTESELVDELKSRLSVYVKDPQVSIFVTQYGSQKVAVMGAVQQPGTYPLKKGSNSLLELLAQAGGVNDKAGNYINFVPSELTGISSATDAEARAQLALATSTQSLDLRKAGIEIYLDQILGTAGTIPLEVPVRGGDMIVIPEAGKAMIEGEVEKPGSYDLGKQFTLLGALAAAGGITYSARIEEVEIVREVGLNEKARLIVDLGRIATGEDRDPRIRNGDLIRVPSHPGRRLTQDTFESITKIINFGIGGSVDLMP